MNSEESAPIIYAIGGPNGAGKTTFAREFLPAVGIEQFLNADSLAAGLSPLRPEAMAVPAARLLLTRWRVLVAARTSFAFESTFSGRTYAPMLRTAKAAGYIIKYVTCGCRAMALPCDVFAIGSVKAGIMFLRTTYGVDTCRACEIFSSFIFRCPMIRCCTRPPIRRHGVWRTGRERPLKCSN